MKSQQPYAKPLMWFSGLIMTAFVAGCGGGGDGRDPVLGTGEIAALAPTVTAVAPLMHAVGVPINTKVITATFSKAMDAATLTGASFTLACPAGAPVTGTVAYLAASNAVTLTLPAASSLAADTLCTATVTTAAKDIAGVPLASNFAWTFKTGAIADATAPTVTGTIHANGATNVAVNTKIGATFSEAMDPLTMTNANFTLKETVSGTAVAGTVGYSGVDAVFIPAHVLLPGTRYTVTVKGGVGGAMDLAGNPLASDFTISWTTAATADIIPPTVILVNPTDLAAGVAINSTVNATFSEAMDPITISTAHFTVAGVTGTVAYNAISRIATFTPSSNLANNTTYTATIKGGINGVEDLAGNALAADKTWRFTTAAIPVIQPSVNLGSASKFGTFGGSAGMTNSGLLTVINGDIGTTAVSTAVTGFHDAGPGCTYTETTLNKGAVNGLIYTAAPPPTVACPSEGTATTFAIATQARADALAAYNALVAMPVGANPGANLAGKTLAPGVYTSPDGSFMIQGGDLTLDAQGDANAIWVFQMATTLTVGGPGAAAPQSIILAGGAQAKNVFWQVGSAATINAAGGGTMAGTIIAQAGAAFSTAGNVAIVTLNGRALSLNSSVTLVNTVINVPNP